MPVLAMATGAVGQLAIPLFADILVDSDASPSAAANPGSHARAITTGTDHGERGHLRDVDAAELGITRHRVRALGLRDGLDQQIGLPVDHAEHGPAKRRRTAARQSARPPGARVVAIVTVVPPDLIRACDPADGSRMLVLCLDDQRGGVAGVVLWGA